MTNEEAIKQIEYAIITGNINDVQCGALKMAIKALEKDIQQKQRVVYYPNGFQRLIRYCPFCGQAIDRLE